MMIMVMIVIKNCQVNIIQEMNIKKKNASK